MSMTREDLDRICADWHKTGGSANSLARAVAEAVANSMYEHGVFDDIDFADYKRALLGPEEKRK